MTNFPKKYDFNIAEPKWQNYWLSKEIYKWDDKESRNANYVIDTPPPTVSGLLHIGHMYSYTHTDFIARFQRMKGKNVFYPMGFDDNGLPTERLVEKKKKIKASQMDRQEFVNICKNIVVEEEEKFKELFQAISLSVDWSNKYQTISKNSQKIAQLSFLDLVKKEQIYRSDQPILWDPIDQTALSQADIEEKEIDSFMNHITFKTEDDADLIIATTRPELLGACVAVFYHPDDERYAHIQGKYAISPLFKVKVPILADDLVKPDKGTGLVMCCTFGDQTDILWWRKHNLPCKMIVTKFGTIEHIKFDDNCAQIHKAEEYAQKFNGLKIKQARESVIEELKASGDLIKQEDFKQNLKCAERSGGPLEIITTNQWYVRVIDHKEDLLKKSSELNWYPESMKIKLDSWINSIGWDWCVSRQRYFGVPFPVWYSKRKGEEGKPIYANPSQLPIDPLNSKPDGYIEGEYEAECDVMDTWFTSSVSPQLNSHAISQDFAIDYDRHLKLYPADLRPQAHEILRSWAFYTILKSYLHSPNSKETELPWKDIMVSGWCLANDKTKMSKSKGNVITPESILNAYGSDVMRYWSASSRLGADTAYSEDILKNGKRLVNKLFNAAKFVSTHFSALDAKDKQGSLQDHASSISHNYDNYFVHKLANVTNEVTNHFNDYEYAQAMEKIEHFFWHEFCDNYLEITKVRAYNEAGANPEGQRSVLLVLYHSYKIMLKLFAPILPAITEELNEVLYADNQEYQSIHIKGNWPKLDKINMKFDEAQILVLFNIVDTVRKQKALDNLSIKAPIEKIHVSGIKAIDADLLDDLKHVTSSKNIVFDDNGSKVDIKVEYAQND